MSPIRALRRMAGMTQAALAKAGGTSQPALAAYEAGRKSPTMATVERLAESVGLEATVEYHPPMTREERRSLALHQAIADRLRCDPEGVVAKAKRTLDLMLAGSAGSSPFLREWKVLLERPPDALVSFLTDRDPWARELRHVTPFAGILTAVERARVYREFSRAEAERGG
ncbi:MAG: helix-turn-helix transcriptional regulator [Gemmatimonadetes bacterium]|nr:helix-turn-helix transcriptional regulator [Gemmatimonadota bacterium]